MKTLVYSVTPSPYQRDLFRALSERSGRQLHIYYFEAAPDDSPWRIDRLGEWESILPGRVFGKGRVRCHWNSPLPTMRGFDRVIVNAPLTGVTTQRLFRQLRGRQSPPWAFWGEQLLPRSGWRGAVQRRLAAPLGTADAIVAIGRTALQDYRRRFPNTPVHNIPYACELSEFQAGGERRNRTAGCRFLFAGQMIERKGVDVLLAAFRQLVNEGLDVSLQLVGREGSLPLWLEDLDEATRARVDYLGFRQPHELPEVFSTADVFVLPSRHDGWGVVVNQALGAAMPVITTTAAGAGRDLVVDGVNGLHVPPGELSPLAEAMRTLAMDQDLRERSSVAAARSASRIGPLEAARIWMHILESMA